MGGLLWGMRWMWNGWRIPGGFLGWFKIYWNLSHYQRVDSNEGYISYKLWTTEQPTTGEIAAVRTAVTVGWLHSMWWDDLAMGWFMSTWNLLNYFIFWGNTLGCSFLVVSIPSPVNRSPEIEKQAPNALSLWLNGSTSSSMISGALFIYTP